MKKFVWSILFIVVAIVIVSVSVSNRGAVSFSLSPLPFEMDMPLYMLLLGAGLIGLIFGGVTVWVSDSQDRKELRAMARNREELIAEIRELSIRLEKQKAGTGDVTALPDAPDFLKIETRRAS